MILTHAVWAQQVAATMDLPDQRLQSRLTEILVDALEHPSASIPQAAGSWSQTKATYRFYANRRVSGRCLAPWVFRRHGEAVRSPRGRAGCAGYHDAELHRLAEH